VSSRIAAEDITQETFIRVWEYISSGREIRQIRAFLFEVCRNLIIDFYRKRERRKQERSLDEMIDSRGVPLQLSYDARQEMERENSLREMLEIMESLSKGDRDILMMRFVDDFKPREIAQTLHINNKNASARIKRAVLRLNKVLNSRVNNK
jgi:RNA polymerase sigma-70 factor (ECF subfamily)